MGVAPDLAAAKVPCAPLAAKLLNGSCRAKEIRGSHSGEMAGIARAAVTGSGYGSGHCTTDVPPPMARFPDCSGQPSMGWAVQLNLSVLHYRSWNTRGGACRPVLADLD